MASLVDSNTRTKVFLPTFGLGMCSMNTSHWSFSACKYLVAKYQFVNKRSYRTLTTNVDKYVSAIKIQNHPTVIEVPNTILVKFS